ncbi:DUF6666 family protein [Alienimonas chondri]|uniref:Porin n=1 Tax=Alienimonas chondri TaxID=2681879 RepID=A0ABX1VAS0_9PLAN|nr:DUF6666 family protein [Alienimonas chondri]NNJ25197.1 hypothetical protein [Alienimonas chondri]
MLRLALTVLLSLPGAAIAQDYAPAYVPQAYATQDGLPPDWLPPPVVAGDWAETLTLFGGISGSKQPQDLGVNAHFGGRLAANYGFALVDAANLGAQIGVAGTYQDDAVRVFESVAVDTDRGQLFTTAGLFQKNELWNWSLVYDALYQDQWDRSTLTQFRGRVGVNMTARDEIGVWGTKNDRGEEGVVAPLDLPVRLQAISQLNLFWRHQYESGAYTTIWGGVSEGHEEMTLVATDDRHLSTAPVFGADFRAPLNDYCSLYGEANFVLPADTGSVDSFLGIDIHPAGVAKCYRKLKYAPILRPAGSPSFVVDARR